MILRLLILLLGTFVGGVQATPVAELTTLARYAPQDSTVFIAIRTDDAYIQALDSLLADLNARTGGQMLPRDFTLRNALNELFTDMSDIPNGFDSAIRPWLGDTAAIILPTGIDLSGNTEPAVLLAASVANRGAAMFFLNLAFTGVSPEQGPGGTLIYAAPGAPFSAALTEDALLLAENRANRENPPQRLFPGIERHVHPDRNERNSYSQRQPAQRCALELHIVEQPAAKARQPDEPRPKRQARRNYQAQASKPGHSRDGVLARQHPTRDGLPWLRLRVFPGIDDIVGQADGELEAEHAQRKRNNGPGGRGVRGEQGNADRDRGDQ